MDEQMRAQRLEAATLRLAEASRYIEALARLDKDLELPPDVYTLQLNFYGVDIRPSPERAREWLLQIRAEIAREAEDYERARRDILKIAAEEPDSE